MIKPHTSLLAIFCFVALVGYAGMSSQAEPKLATESYMIPSRDSGIQLHVRNKRPEGMIQFSPEKTLLYVHGTTQAASSTFDLPLDGLSWMDYIAHMATMSILSMCGVTVVPRAHLKWKNRPLKIHPSSEPMLPSRT